MVCSVLNAKHGECSFILSGNETDKIYCWRLPAPEINAWHKRDFIDEMWHFIKRRTQIMDPAGCGAQGK
ncbi:MAG: hypothetical protein FWF54_03075 [Candidatus Azobacteroides sp.]|nr:hypothetical protein [Candidatus Azobacteroides sp.]